MVKKILLTLLFLRLATIPVEGQINVFPDVEDFENEIICPNSCAPLCSLIGKWKNAVDIGLPAANLNWNSFSGPTPSSDTGPFNDHTEGDTSGRYIFLESSCANIGNPLKSGFLVSEWYDFSLLNEIGMRFWYNMYGASMGYLSLDVDTTGAGTWINNLMPPITDDDTSWQERVLRLDQFAGTDSIRFRFRGVTGNSFLSDMALDDIEIFPVAPHDLSAVAITAPTRSGCDIGSDTIRAQFLYVGADSAFPGMQITFAYRVDSGPVIHDTLTLSNTLAFGDTVFINFSTPWNFPPGGPYQLWVWNTWSADSVYNANDSLFRSIISLPQIYSFPYDQDFESGQELWQSGGNLSTWAFGTPAKTTISGAASGQNAWVTGGLGPGNYLNEEVSWVQSGCFDLSGICNPWMEMMLWYEAETNWDGGNVTYSTDGGQTWQLLGALGDPYNWYNDPNVNGGPGGFFEGWSGAGSAGSGGYLKVKHELTGLANQRGVIFRVNLGSDTGFPDEGLAFDDFRIYNGVYLGKDTVVCVPDTTFITAQGETGDSWLWNTGDTTQTLPVTQTGNYSVQMNHAGCIGTDTLFVVAIDSSSKPNLGPDTLTCASSVQLDAGSYPSATYLWSTGDSGRVISVNATANVELQIILPCDTLRDTIAVTVQPLPQVDLGPDTAVCGAINLMANIAASSYLWSTGDTSSNTLASASGAYWLAATDSVGCSAADTLNLTLLPTTPVELWPDTSYCDGDTLCLMAGPTSGATYVWSNGVTGPVNCIANPGSYAVHSTDTNGCESTDTIAVIRNEVPVPFGNYSPAATPPLTYDFNGFATGNPNSWSWTFGDGGGSVLQNPTHTYSGPGTYSIIVTASNVCGTGSDTLSLVIVGIGESLGESLMVYPNPSNGNLYLETHALPLKEPQLELFAADGRRIPGLKWSKSSENRLLIQFPESCQGVYLLQVNEGQFLQTFRIFVVRD